MPGKFQAAITLRSAIVHWSSFQNQMVEAAYQIKNVAGYSLFNMHCSYIKTSLQTSFVLKKNNISKNTHLIN